MKRRHIIVTSGLVAIVALTVVICIIMWMQISDDECNPDAQSNFTQVNISNMTMIEIRQHHLHLNFYHVVHTTRAARFISRGFLARGVNNSESTVVDTWDKKGSVMFHWRDGSSLAFQQMAPTDLNMECVHVEWRMPKGYNKTPADCFDMKTSLWYGGFEKGSQFWPINKENVTMVPFVTGDGYTFENIGDLIEGLFVSSAGLGIYVYGNSSSYLSLNEGGSKLLCMRGKIGPGTPYVNTHIQPVQSYDICQATDITQLWKGMARKYLPKPTGIPSEDVLRYPIWSTWARYKGYINQSKVLEFATEIKTHSFGISQLELDDDWTPKYGDFTFAKDKFPSAKDMVSKLAAMDVPLTVWMHPFFNNDSRAFGELSKSGFLVKTSQSSKNPVLTSWWRGKHAGILDVTNAQATEWYLKKTRNLQKEFNVTSFKFDAGEVNWLPDIYYVETPMVNPNYFSHLFAQMAYKADKINRRQEVRAGFLNQNLPILVRMIDRESNWSHLRGLKTLLPCALSMSLMGYPFVLPDMVGGNAYDPTDLDKTVYPDPELFVRWLQATALMPTIQFSIPPWFYNDTVVQISRKYTTLHEFFSDKIISLAQNAVVRGDPILRPLWWLAPEDEEALKIESEFLLGDDLLVAPVLNQGVTERDIYLPQGQWREESHGTHKIYSGPTWLKDFHAPLEVLPYFTKVHNM